MLEVLAERQVTIPELGTFAARSSPWVILTSNDTRELSPALKRRCVHFQVDYPDVERERAIVSVRAPEVEPGVVADVVDLARRLRELPLRKSPSIAEVIDAARAASYLRTTTAAHAADVTHDRTSTDRALLALLVKFGSDLDIARAMVGTPASSGSDIQDSRPSASDGSSPRGSLTATAFGSGRARSVRRR